MGSQVSIALKEYSSQVEKGMYSFNLKKLSIQENARKGLIENIKLLSN